MCMWGGGGGGGLMDYQHGVTPIRPYILHQLCLVPVQNDIHLCVLLAAVFHPPNVVVIIV